MLAHTHPIKKSRKAIAFRLIPFPVVGCRKSIINILCITLLRMCRVWLDSAVRCMVRAAVEFRQTPKMFDRCTTSTATIIRSSRSTCSNQMNKCTHKHGKATRISKSILRIVHKFIYINSRKWKCDVGVNYYREYGREHARDQQAHSLRT